MSDPAIRVTLHGKAFSFETGRLNVVMGPNGGGKTTLLSALALRSMARFEGDIQREGHTKAMDIAYLPQGVWDLDDIALNGFLRLCRRGHVRPGPGHHLEKYCLLLPRNLEDLSGGERRLLLFLAVAVQQQAIHIYDEPFQFLDRTTREIVTGVLVDLVREGKLVIVVVHENELSEQVAFSECLFHVDEKSRLSSGAI